MTTNTNTAPALREKLIELIAGHLSGTYHCLRVWEAWHVGTMSQDDFEDVGESDTPAELAEAILAALASAAQPPEGYVLVPMKPTEAMKVHAVKCINGDAVYKVGSTKVLREEEDTYGEVYEAMLEAAPKEVKAVPTQRESLTSREVELLDGMIEVQLHHANRSDNIGNRPMAEKQKAWDMERVELLKKLKASYAPREPLTDAQIEEIYWTDPDRRTFRGFARAIEAAHGITAHKEQG